MTPRCRSIQINAFKGDRSRPFATNFRQQLQDGRNGVSQGPNFVDCLLYAGHTGVSTDGGTTIYGFNAYSGGILPWELVGELKRGNALPGIVTDDSAVFATAYARGLAVASFSILVPDLTFAQLKNRLDDEIKKSQYTYGLPDGDGECNCVTWLERIGIPLLSGRMDEFIELPSRIYFPSRRFGKCV